MGHKFSHHQEREYAATYRYGGNVLDTSSPRTCNSGLESCRTCKDTNTTCIKSKQEKRFTQLLVLCQAFEEQYPEVWKQFVIQYYLAANFRFPQKKKNGRKMSSSHDSAPGKLCSTSMDEHSQNVIYTNNSFKVSSLPTSNDTITPLSAVSTFAHHSYSVGSMSDCPNSNIMVNSNDANITEKVVHLPESIRREFDRIERICASQDFDITSEDDMFPNVEIGNNIACEGGDKNPQFGQVLDQFMREFIEYNMKHWKIPNKLEDVNMVKLFEDFLKHANK